MFAAGRFGADVGAAIVFPAGAAVAALAVPGAFRVRGRWWVLALVVAAPVLGLAALFAIDLALGGDAHLSRSVIDAGGAGELADVVERRLRLAASSFGRGVQTILFWFCVLAVLAGAASTGAGSSPGWRRRRWRAPASRARRRPACSASSPTTRPRPSSRSAPSA